ncbi:MAG TPA: hypothetical protein VIF57_05095 [Polyangia bacterium]
MNRARAIVVGLCVGAACAAVGLGSCTKNDSLVLLDLRTSGPLGAPIAGVRLSAKGWPTRTVGGDIGLAGLQVGYYGPGNGGAVSVTVEALDAVDCVLGSGTGTVAKLAAGATSDPTLVFIRPLPANGCVPDAGSTDDGGVDGGDDGGGDDGGADGGTDASDDTAGDAGDDSAADAGSDVGVDSAADAMDAATTDAPGDATNDAAGDADLDGSPGDGA